jgi:hypothetical protein
MQLRLPYRGLISLALFATLCGILAFWALRLLAPASPVAPATLAPPASGPIDTTRAAALLSAPAVSVEPAARAPVNVRIVGVLAAESRGNRPANSPGVALISIDGQAARPYALGQTLPNGMRVQAIRRDSVDLLDQGRLLTAPTPSAPALGVLTQGRAGATGGGAGPAPTAGSDPRTPLNAAVPAPMPIASPMPAPGAPVGPDGTVLASPPPGAEAPMPPPPPIPASGPVPGPVFPPGSR